MVVMIKEFAVLALSNPNRTSLSKRPFGGLVNYLAMAFELCVYIDKKVQYQNMTSGVLCIYY